MCPHENVNDFISRKILKKCNKSYSALYSQACYETRGTYESLKTPSQQCQDLRNKIITDHGDNFKTKLGPSDRMNCPPVKLTLNKNKNINPLNHVRHFDTPFHLRKSWEKELCDALEGEILVPNRNPSQWASRAFPVQKSDPSKVRIVADFRELNKALARPHWPTESSN